MMKAPDAEQRSLNVQIQNARLTSGGKMQRRSTP